MAQEWYTEGGPKKPMGSMVLRFEYAESEVGLLIHVPSGGQVRVQVIMAISFLKAMVVSSD